MSWGNAKLTRSEYAEKVNKEKVLKALSCALDETGCAPPPPGLRLSVWFQADGTGDFIASGSVDVVPVPVPEKAKRKRKVK